MSYPSYTETLNIHVHVNPFNETRQSKQLHPKTTPFFSRKNELPQAGFEPMMSCVLGDTLQLSHRGSSAGQAESLKFMQGKGCLSPDGQGNQS